MSLIIAGTLRIPPQNIDALRPALKKVLQATHAEDGCVEYCFAEDLAEPGLLRLFEVWRDQAALDAHLKTPHLAEWRETAGAAGVADRRLFAYDAGDGRPL